MKSTLVTALLALSLLATLASPAFAQVPPELYQPPEIEDYQESRASTCGWTKGAVNGSRYICLNTTMRIRFEPAAGLAIFECDAVVTQSNITILHNEEGVAPFPAVNAGVSCYAPPNGTPAVGGGPGAAATVGAVSIGKEALCLDASAIFPGFYSDSLVTKGHCTQWRAPASSAALGFVGAMFDQ